MDFNEEDIKAVAESRVKREQSKNTNKWFWGMVIGMLLGGLVYAKFNVMIGGGIIALSVVSFWWYTSTLAKKQNSRKAKMINEWRQERSKVIK